MCLCFIDNERANYFKKLCLRNSQPSSLLYYLLLLEEVWPLLIKNINHKWHGMNDGGKAKPYKLIAAWEDKYVMPKLERLSLNVYMSIIGRTLNKITINFVRSIVSSRWLPVGIRVSFFSHHNDICHIMLFGTVLQSFRMNIPNRDCVHIK